MVTFVSIIFLNILKFLQMKTYFLFTLLTLSLSFTMDASTIQISNSNNPIIDGIYEESKIVQGAVSYSKKYLDRQVTISRFQLDQNGTIFIGWMISDSRGNEFFAINSDSDFPPAFGWDVAKAGRDSNADFELTFKSTTSNLVFKNETKTLVNIFPNPTSGVINIEANNEFTSLNLYNSAGSLVMTSNEKFIDLSNLKNDLYSIEIISGDSRVVKKVVKQ
jgi:hypothetical protein